FLRLSLPPRAPLFPYTTLFRSIGFDKALAHRQELVDLVDGLLDDFPIAHGSNRLRYTSPTNSLPRFVQSWAQPLISARRRNARADRKSTRLNSSHVKISYAVFC